MLLLFNRYPKSDFLRLACSVPDGFGNIEGKCCSLCQFFVNRLKQYLYGALRYIQQYTDSLMWVAVICCCWYISANSVLKFADLHTFRNIESTT